MALLKRRRLIQVCASGTMASKLRGAPALSALGVDHLKFRVANAGAAAVFYYQLFGGEVIPVSNSTMPDQPRVDELFLRLGSPPYPYLMFSQLRAGEQTGLDHLSMLAATGPAVRSALEGNGVALIDPDRGYWFRDA